MSGSSLEAVKLLKDWSTWMAGIQAALIAYLYTAGLPQVLGSEAYLIKTTIFFFALSIVFAGLLLGGLPALVDEEPQQSGSVYDRKLKLGGMDTYDVRFLVVGQHSCFFTGLCFLLFAILP